MAGFNHPLLHLFRHHSNPLPVQERFIQQFQRSFTVTKPTVYSLVCGSSGEELWLLESASKFCFFWGGKVHPEISHVEFLLAKSTVLFHHKTLSPEYFSSNNKSNPTESSSSNHKHSKLTVPINRLFSGLDCRREMQILAYRGFIL